jgi:hypothetical protein
VTSCPAPSRHALNRTPTQTASQLNSGTAALAAPTQARPVKMASRSVLQRQEVVKTGVIGEQPRCTRRVVITLFPLSPAGQQ